jgi:ElaB/YqjD/DUF883 family membrane-anchored ribosome-binding protein
MKVSQLSETLTEDARALVAATAGIAEETVAGARRRISAAIDGGRTLYDRAEARAMDGIRYTDDAVRGHTYQSIAIALGVGALLAVVLMSQCSRTRR